MVSLKKNVLANYAGQIYLSLIGLLMLPTYVKYMGAEAFGLVGFFAMLQVVFNLLDLGLTPTMSRETARFHTGVLSKEDYRRLFRALNVVFCIIAILGAAILLSLSSLVVRDWLKVGTLPFGEVKIAVQLMAISVALRWMEGLYRGVIIGSERLVWFSGYLALFATLRFVVVLPVMWYFGFTPLVFFLHQLVVTALEVLGFWLEAARLLPSLPKSGRPIGWSLAPIRPVLTFSLTIAFTSAVWVLVTQSDKFILSGILSLKDYGFFTLAVLVASGITIISGPISNVIMPRMAALHSEGRHDEMVSVYREFTQLVSITAGASAITLACCAKPVLFAWTGDLSLAERAAPILRLYAVGNGFLAISAFPYYLQYAQGNLRYHLVGNVGFIVVLIPLIVLAATRWGGVGAGYVWILANAGYLFLWVPYVHHKLQPGLHMRWMFNDVFAVTVIGALLAILTSFLRLDLTSRVVSAIFVVAVGMAVVVCSTLCSKSARVVLLGRLIRRN